MTDKNLNKIVEFLEGLQEQMQDGDPTSKVEISNYDLCRALCATGKYDPFGYKYPEVTQQDRNEKMQYDTELEEKGLQAERFEYKD